MRWAVGAEFENEKRAQRLVDAWLSTTGEFHGKKTVACGSDWDFLSRRLFNGSLIQKLRRYLEWVQTFAAYVLENEDGEALTWTRC